MQYLRPAWTTISIATRSFSQANVVRSFHHLGVVPDLVAQLASRGIREPTAIQSLAIPLIAGNKDVLVQSQTGSGKTLTYLLPLLSKGLSPSSRAMIVVPTRELAVQTYMEINRLSKSVNSHVLLSGRDSEAQAEQFVRDDNASVIIGTPTRLVELVEHVNKNVKYIILDEVDELIDALPSFVPEKKKKLRLKHPRPTSVLLDHLYFNGEGRSTNESPSPVRSLQFIGLSATMNATLKRELFVHGWCRSPVVAKLQDGIPTSITHTYVTCREDSLLSILATCIHDMKPTSAFIFVPPSVRLATLLDLLSSVEITAKAVCEHVNTENTTDMIAQRKTLSEYIEAGKEGAPSIRGFDLPSVSHAFIIGSTRDHIEYQHVCGRIGRVGHQGKAVTLLYSEEDKARHEKALKKLGLPVTRDSAVEGDGDSIAAPAEKEGSVEGASDQDE